MVEFIKTCDQYPCKFNFDHFFQLRNPPPFCGGKMDFQKMSKNEGIQIFDSQMYF